MRRKPSAGHDAMHRGMMMESLSPGVQDGEKSALGSQAFRIEGNLEEGFGHGTEMQSIDQSLILQGQGSHDWRQGEHHLVVRDRQKFC